MNRHKNMILILSLSIVSTQCVHAEVADDSTEQKEAVIIALTKFDVNETNLELRWNIKNNSDHDIWICKTIGTRTWEDNTFDYETFLDEDLRTLVISCRLAKPIYAIFPQTTNFFGKYIRLRAGQDRTESFTFAIPFDISPFLENEMRGAPYATRLAIEIGYYDEDLPALILQIVDVARRLNCESIDFEDYYNDYRIFRRYFGGMLIEDTFNKWADFRESVESGSDEIILPYMTQFHNIGEHILDEQFLRLEIDNVLIPIEGNWSQLTNNGSKETIKKQKKQASRTDTEKSASEKAPNQSDTKKS